MLFATNPQLKRHFSLARGLNRRRHRGEAGLQRWLGWGILVNISVVLATRLARR